MTHSEPSNAATPRPRAAVAYLNTEYPSLSHTFIEREVRSVRERGVAVRTYSIRRPGATGRIGAAHDEAARETRYVLDGAGALVVAQVLGLLTNPAGFIRAHARAQRLSPGGVRARLLHAAYAAEGVRLARMLAQDGLRHVHVHMANNGAMVALLACRFDARLRYSLTIHGSAEFFDVHRLQLGAKAEGAAFVRCISSFCKAQVMTWSDPSAWERFHVVHTGLDVGRFAPPDARPVDRLRIVSVGRFVPIKGYDVLLDACRALSASGADWSLDMVGDGPMRGALERKARSAGVAERVTFRGAVPQEEMPKLLAGTNVLVVSSFMEGVPVVLMEAMATGMAVVATSVGGTGELVRHEENGLLVEPGSPDALAAALLRLARDAALRASLGAAARATVTRDFDVESAGAAMAALFERYAPSGGTS